MSYCTILITKKSETLKIQEALTKLSNRDLPFGKEIVTKYYSKNNFKNIDFIQKSLDEYDMILLENSYSSFANYATSFNTTKEKKIKKFLKKGWSKSEIQEWIELQEKKNKSTTNQIKKQRESVIFEISKNYFIAFGYYWQGKDENKADWQGFREQKVVTEPQGEYKENVIYVIDEKMHKKVLNALSYSIGSI